MVLVLTYLVPTQYPPCYDQPTDYLTEAGPSTSPTGTPMDSATLEKPRGRKRTRNPVGLFSNHVDIPNAP